MGREQILIDASGSRLRVTPNRKTLHISTNDTVEWITNPRNMNFVVCFGRRTPFKMLHYGKVGSNSRHLSANSGKIKVAVRNGRAKSYKYTVIAADQVLDPGVIIQL
jgi:hypothetical protein